MDIRSKIKTLLNEAGLYQVQGLLSESRDKYQAALDIISSLQNLKHKEHLINSITEKLHAIEKITKKVEFGPLSPELSEKGQNLIKNLFGENDLEKAVALAKFGQFERAMTDLEKLLKKDEFRLEAAKNMIRCKMAMGSVDDAVDQYQQWFSLDLFIPEELETIRVYLKRILEKKGLDTFLPAPVCDAGPSEKDGKKAGGECVSLEPPEEFLDITSIGITFTSGSQNGKMVEFDVNFQSGDMLSLIIPKNDKSIIEDLKEGDALEDVQFYSPIAIFTGSAVVAVKTQIESGPKRGDFCLDLKISTQ